MTNSKTTKKALFSSVVALLLCFTMLLGTTFAWFTDSASTGVNTIQAGNLDIVVSYATQSDVVDGAIPDSAWTVVDENSPVFDENALWEPGYTEVVYFKIENAGSLALKYIMSANIASETAGTNKDGEEFNLSEYLSAYYMTGDTATVFTTRENAQTVDGWASMVPDLAPATLGEAVNAETGSAKALSYEYSLEAGEVAYTTMAVFMPTNIGNEANHDGTNKPSIKLGINLLATQYTYENDSFDDQYDKDAAYPPLADIWDGTVDTVWYNETDTEFIITTAEELAGFADLVNSGNTFVGKTVKIGEHIDLNNLQWTPIGNNINYFMGDFDGQDYTISNLTIDANTPETDQYVGLFGGVKNATVKNLTVKDTSITTVGAKVRAAAIAGLASSDTTQPAVLALTFENIKVDGCTITAEATSNSAYVGGIAGYGYPANQNNITVSGLTINAKAANSTVMVAAMVGYQMGQNISNNGNTRMAFTIDTFKLKDITINAQANTVYAGGYTGYAYYGYRTIKNGTIEGIKMDVDSSNAFVGGLVGQLWRGDNLSIVTDVNITGIDFDVTTAYHGETRVGGMVGTSQSTVNYTDCSTAGKITEQCSTGVVNHHAKVGGFVGRAYTWGQNYTNCMADVDVTGSHVAGGFIGNHITSATYTNCEAKGDVTANIAGGFAGRLTEHGYSAAVTFDGCKVSGNVTGTNVAGGFIGSTADHGWSDWVAGVGTGYAKDVTIKNCEITGTVTSGTDYCAGVVGEAVMAEDVEITLENVECDITPSVYPNE